MTTPVSSLSRSLLLLLAFCLAPACDADLGELGGDTDAGSETGNTQSGPGGSGFEPCSAENTCPDGLFCFNGICALGCTNNDNCADDQYCDTSSLLCQNSEVSSCVDDGGCLGEQICLEGLCSTPPTSAACNPEGSPDGCESDAICLEADVTACYTLPACGEDGSCPVGLGGAVCNNDYLPNKDRVCILGVCETSENCPEDWFCTKPSGGPLGLCSNGSLGSPCTNVAECVSGVCNNQLGILGVCG